MQLENVNLEKWSINEISYVEYKEINGGGWFSKSFWIIVSAIVIHYLLPILLI